MRNGVQNANRVGRLKTFMIAAGLVGSVGVASASVLDRPFFSANATVIVFGADGFNEEGGTAPIVFDFLALDFGASGQAAPDLIAFDGRTINFNNQTFNPIFSEQAGGNEFQVNDAVSGGEFNTSAPNQILDASDSYNAFTLDGDTDIDLLNGGARASRFYVASNSAFDIFAQADNLTTSGTFDTLDFSNIRYRIRFQTTGGGGAGRWGVDAQDPSVGGEGIVIGQDQDIANAPLATLADISTGPTKVFDGGRKTAARPGGIISQAVSFQSRYNLIGSGINANNYDFSLGAGTIAADVTYTVYVP